MNKITIIAARSRFLGLVIMASPHMNNWFFFLVMANYINYIIVKLLLLRLSKPSSIEYILISIHKFI